MIFAIRAPSQPFHLFYDKMEQKIDAILERQKALMARVKDLQAEAAQAVPEQSALEKRTYDTSVALGLHSFKLLRVAPEYYTWSLEQRRKTLGGYSQHHLCKTIILENTEWNAELAKIGPGAHPECGDPTYSRFYAVIIQYTTRLMSHKVFKFCRSLRPDLSKKTVHFNAAKPEDAVRLTESLYNGVCPIGNPVNIPIILSSRILDLKPDFMWLGGGEVDLKLGFSAKEFVDKVNPYVADVTFEEYDFNIPMEAV